MSEIDDTIKTMEGRMAKAIDATRNDFASVRTGRASPALLDRIQVEAYGAMAPLKSMASISTPDARTLQISAFDRNTVGAIRKAIETSDLGLTPNIDGSTIRLQIPQPTEDRRKDLVKVIKKKPKTVRSPCVTCATNASMRSRRFSKTARSPKTTTNARASASRKLPISSSKMWIRSSSSRKKRSSKSRLRTPHSKEPTPSTQLQSGDPCHRGELETAQFPNDKLQIALFSYEGVP